MDVRDWMEQGIVDVVIGQTFSGPELVDSTIDFRPHWSKQPKVRTVGFMQPFRAM